MEGSAIDQIADIVVTPYRLSNCAINLTRAKKNLDANGVHKAREQLKEYHLQLIKGRTQENKLFV